MNYSPNLANIQRKLCIIFEQEHYYTNLTQSINSVNIHRVIFYHSKNVQLQSLPNTRQFCQVGIRYSHPRSLQLLATFFEQSAQLEQFEILKACLYDLFPNLANFGHLVRRQHDNWYPRQLPLKTQSPDNLASVNHTTCSTDSWFPDSRSSDSSV